MSKYFFSKNGARGKESGFFEITARNFPQLKDIAIQDLNMVVGGFREPHLHPNAMQLDFCISGQGEIGILEPDGEEHIIELTPGDAAFIPRGFVHWIKNTDSGNSRFLLIVSNELPETIEVASSYNALPVEFKYT